MKLGGNIPHMILTPGKGLLCKCGAKAWRFILCVKCRHIVATCGNHNMTIEQEREAHCR